MEPVCFGQPEGRKKGGEGASMKGPGPMEGCGAALEVTARRFRTTGLLGVKTRWAAGLDGTRHYVIR